MYPRPETSLVSVVECFVIIFEVFDPVLYKIDNDNIDNDDIDNSNVDKNDIN